METYSVMWMVLCLTAIGTSIYWCFKATVYKRAYNDVCNENLVLLGNLAFLEKYYNILQSGNGLKPTACDVPEAGGYTSTRKG